LKDTGKSLYLADDAMLDLQVCFSRPVIPLSHPMGEGIHWRRAEFVGLIFLQGMSEGAQMQLKKEWPLAAAWA